MSPSPDRDLEKKSTPLDEYGKEIYEKVLRRTTPLSFLFRDELKGKKEEELTPRKDSISPSHFLAT